MSLLSRKTAKVLREIYKNHRAPESWGTPEVSRHVFQALEDRGFLAGTAELIARLKGVGGRLSLVQKVMALVAGVGLVTLADRLMPNEKKAKITHRAKRTFSPRAWGPAVVLYTVGAALLFASNGGGDGGPPPPPPDEDTMDYHVTSQYGRGDGVEEEWEGYTYESPNQNDWERPGSN